MQVSVQTDRKKKPELMPIGVVGGLPEVQEEDEKQKERRIKKLTLINRQLIQTLKRQNEELTKKINKQKMKVGRSMERVQSPAKNLEREKKELTNAYKQIQMYKTVLKDLKAKQISTQSVDKLNMLENKIKYQDSTIQKLQKQLKYVKNIKQQQEKELHLYENQDIKTSIGQLEEQLKQLKEKLKVSKKQTKKREQMSLKQHTYFMELEKMLRKQNDEYYPGVTQGNKTKRESATRNNTAEDVTERQWQIIRAQLAELKKEHDESNKKIEQLTRLRNKEIKSVEENESILKERQRKLQTVKMKLSQLAKLVGNQKEEQNGSNRRSHNQSGEYGQKFEGVMQNGKKVYKAKNPEDERETKRWMIPHGYIQEKGKVIPDSTYFSDKAQLKLAKKHKIIKIQVWSDSAGTPSVCQYTYLTEENKRIQGLNPYSPAQLRELDDKIIQYKEGDYLSKIIGRINEGFLTSISYISKFGKRQTFNQGASGQQFKFQPRPNQIPTYMFGATAKNNRDQIRICHIGCEFIADW